jgi:hypothetical protein
METFSPILLGPGLSPASFDVALKTNAITYCWAIIASAIANGLRYTVFSEALHELPGSYS